MKKYLVCGIADVITVINLVEIYADGTRAFDESFSVGEGEFFGFPGLTAQEKAQQ